MWTEMLNIARDIALDVILTLAVLIPLLLIAAGTQRLALRVRAQRSSTSEPEQ